MISLSRMKFLLVVLYETFTAKIVQVVKLRSRYGKQ